MANKKQKFPDIWGYDFVEEIKRFKPCQVYFDYINSGILEPGDTLSDILSNAEICIYDKNWLVSKLLGCLKQDNDITVIGYNAMRLGFGVEILKIYRIKDILPYLEWVNEEIHYKE